MILHDLKYAVKALRRMPVFTTAALLSLTVGIAASAAVFSLVDSALLRTPPFPEANRLVVLNITQRTPAAGELRQRWSWPRFQLLQKHARSFEAIATSSNNVVTLTGTTHPEPLRIELVSARYLDVMRAPLVIGQGFGEDTDSAAEKRHAVVLGHELWQRRFGGTPNVLGSTLHLNGVPLTVIGVAAPAFTGVSGLAQAWIPATAAPLVTYRDYQIGRAHV